MDAPVSHLSYKLGKTLKKLLHKLICVMDVLRLTSHSSLENLFLSQCQIKPISFLSYRFFFLYNFSYVAWFISFTLKQQVIYLKGQKKNLAGILIGKVKPVNGKAFTGCVQDLKKSCFLNLRLTDVED